MGATFQYTLDTSQSVNTQIIIRNRKPWAEEGATVIKTLPIGVNQWDGTNNAGQSVPEGEYWFTVEVKNSSNELIGRQSGPVRVGCQKIYLPLIFKNYGSPGPPGGCYVGRVLIEDGFENGDPFSGSGTSPAGPWTRAGLEGFPAPDKVSLDDHDRPDNDGIRLGGQDNQSSPDDQTDDFDQARPFLSMPVPKQSRFLLTCGWNPGNPRMKRSIQVVMTTFIGVCKPCSIVTT